MCRHTSRIAGRLLVNTVTIDVYPDVTAYSGDFRAALARAESYGQQRFSHRGTIFVLTRQRGPKTTLRGPDALLPIVFESELKIHWVSLRASAVACGKARPGWYVGANFGFPNAVCCIDPSGRTNAGRPTFYAHGKKFASVKGLFQAVTTGNLTPGDGGDIWDGRIRS